MKKLRAAVLAAALGIAMAVPIINAPSAEAHGWMTNPPSRQDLCADRATSFDCGAIKYEPQSVEARKGSMKCSGGNERFSILDDESRDWPVTEVDNSITLKWNITAAHATSTWEYFIDGDLIEEYDQNGQRPPSTVSHTISNLPQGQHTLLARWNVADTQNAFYSCIDIQVGEGNGDGGDQDGGDQNGSDENGNGDDGNGDDGGEPGTCDAEEYSSSEVYLGGDRVSYSGKIYEANWWVLGETPSNTEWGPWTEIGPCDDGSDQDGSDQDGSDNDGSDDDGSDQDGADEDGSGDDGSDENGSDPDPPADPGDYVVGYFTNWGIYDRDYQVKDIVDSGSADKLTHILYAFGNVQNGQCTVGDSFADYEKTFTAEESVDGEADAWDDPLRGNFNQLKKLKEQNPNLKVLWSFGGWTWSGGFGEAAANAESFADSCYDLIHDSRWDGVFDGIDIDWEYPNDCGETCDESGYESFPTLMEALRDKFGDDELVTAAISADASSGGKLDNADYGTAAEYVDFYMPMTYDYFGAWDAQGPTAPHSPLDEVDSAAKSGFHTSATIDKLRGMDIPSDKLLLGLGFYGRGWGGVTDEEPGGSATGPAHGTFEDGIEDYKVLKDKCPPTGEAYGTAYAFCDGEWWGYDTPDTISGKMGFARDEGLAGAFFWELSGDTSDGELISAIHDGLPN